MNDFVYLLILNWNGWKDTLECLESVLRMDHSNYRVIICDNASKNDSLQQIRDWLEGKSLAPISKDSPLLHLSSPPVPKPIDYVEHTRSSAESGGSKEDAQKKVVLIDNQENLGFAGGNNVGLRYALNRNDSDYIWLLNNDTVIEPSTLSAMLRRIKASQVPCVCGSKIIFYDDPSVVQALGGASYNKWTGLGKSIGLNQATTTPVDTDDVEKSLSYLMGASILIPQNFLHDVGLLSEDYFLYYEEIDWQTRANTKYKMVYAGDAIVYHKEGKSIGSSSDKLKTTLFSDFYWIKNKIVFSEKFFPESLPTIYAITFLQILNRIRRLQWDKAGLMTSILLGRRTFKESWRGH